MADQKFGSVGEYIGSFPADVQAILEQVRRAILDAVPGAGETISYHMPTIEHNRPTIPFPKSSGSFQGWGPRLAGS